MAGWFDATFLVVFLVVFGCWLGFFGAFGSGLSCFVSLVCMALCCFLRVVVVSACCVCFGFSLVDGFWVAFCCWLSGGLGFAVFWVKVLLFNFWQGFFWLMWIRGKIVLTP